MAFLPLLCAVVNDSLIFSGDLLVDGTMPRNKPNVANAVISMMHSTTVPITHLADTRKKLTPDAPYLTLHNRRLSYGSLTIAYNVTGMCEVADTILEATTLSEV